MKLEKAIKSGFPFKRPADKEWYHVTRAGYIGVGDGETVYVILPPTAENILADDWEVDEPVITITKSVFEAAAEDWDPHGIATRQMWQRLIGESK